MLINSNFICNQIYLQWIEMVNGDKDVSIHYIKANKNKWKSNSPIHKIELIIDLFLSQAKSQLITFDMTPKNKILC